jgi:ligand-binding sensor domain-containing protein/nitrogen-specific signal transduction histidine kinase/CheY-like chemotaxis protein
MGWLAAAPSALAEVLSFRTYSVQDGLGQSQVFTVLQDRRGYLWVGTSGGGVSRFDGLQFKTFYERDGLSDATVYSIIEDQQGRLWIATASGATVIEGSQLRSLKADQGLVDEPIWGVVEDQEGGLWFATIGAGLLRYDSSRGIVLTRFTEAEGLPDNEVRHVSVDQQGRIWGATYRGAFVLDGDDISVFKEEQGLPSDEVRWSQEDTNGGHWFATDQGVSRLQNGVWQTYTTADGLADNAVWSVFPDVDGDIWFTTSNGVSRFDGRHFHSWTVDHGLPNRFVSAMTRDRDGNLWLATDGGLARFFGYHIRSIRANDGLPDSSVWNMLWDSSGFMWIATEVEIVRYYPERDLVVRAVKEQERICAFALAYGADGELWMGGDSRLYRQDGAGYEDVSEKLGLPEVTIFTITRDRLGQLWIGTDLGIFVVTKDRLIATYDEEVGLPQGNINAIYEDLQGSIWIGTDRGAYRCQNGELSQLELADQLLTGFVMAIAEDQAGRLWFATYGDGVVGHHPHTGDTVSVTSSQGLIDDTVSSLIVDDVGRLWIGTNRGVSHLDTGHYHQSGELSIESYGYYDGFDAIECNQGGMTLDDQGRVWVGTIGGAYILDSREQRAVLAEPRTQITGILLFLEPLEAAAYASGIDAETGLPTNLALPAAQNHLTFEFTGIHLSAPEQVKYQFRLQGFESAWSPVTTQRQATYANLPPGDYTFQVRASCDGQWRQTPTELTFRVLTPWWRRWWFLTLLGLALGGGVLTAYRVRMHGLRRYQHLLESEIDKRTQELHLEKQKVERINLELEDRVRERTEKLAAVNKKLMRAEKMEAIGQLAGGVAHDLNNILAGIVSYPELLLLRLPEDSPFREYILAIKRSGMKAADIVQDLLTLARRGISEKSVLDLNRVVKEYLSSPEHLLILAECPEITVDLELDPDLPKISGYHHHLSKSLMNLVANAAEAIPEEGGRICIATREQELSAPLRGYPDVVAGRYAVLLVSDTGAGIAEQDLERIFEPFYSKKKLGRSGTGLGMTVVWGTVADHNGYITVDSSEQSGTTFNLYFPVSDVQHLAEDEAAESGELVRGRGEQVLLVDDVAEQRRLGVSMLKQLGYRVDTVASGEEAVNSLRGQEYSVVVLDMIMEPGMDGLDTFREIRKLRPQQRAIIVSGYSESARVREAIALGVSAYVQKPYSLATIGKALQRALSQPS